MRRRTEPNVIPDEGITLTIRWPFWLHPFWPAIVLAGLMALAAAFVLPETFASEWRVPKYIDGDLPLILTILMATFLVGMLVGTGLATRGGTTTIQFTPRQIRYLQLAYGWLFALTILGYLLWFLSAVGQGVSLNELLQVLSRDEGAIGNLKENSRPIGGVTTMTQFGPVAIGIGVILRKLGFARRVYWWIVGLAAFRALFYAERLALIEVIVPVILFAALTVDPPSRTAKWVRAAPILAVPMIWALFAIFEYSRSWVYYQWITPLPFGEWVTLRLAGYYTTSFNNSALMVEATRGVNSLPYFSMDGFWNAPFIAVFWPHPGIQGLEPTEWWAQTLSLSGNPEFNNTGSFLVTYAEFGGVFAALIWLVLGVVVGAIFAKMTKGSFPALLAVATLYVGLLELSRFLYWTQGRAFPVLLALVIIAFTYPVTTAKVSGVSRTQALMIGVRDSG